ncbi:MAG: gliding motility protein GldM [Lewinellaceae bacterium]|nr:gliding motility protein GldM [Lewinellaceae bacterium]MCB9353745.1 gliding motility protein GldM [Lewinellaceae bacterium]
MSIPKEPRQLMINLMYLVLTALLALNVSAEVMNAFFSLDKGMKTSGSIVDNNNNALLAGMSATAEAYPTDKNKELQAKAAEAQRIGDEFVKYIDGIRDRLFEIAKGPSESNPDIPRDIRNKDVTTNMFINENVGGEIEAKIKETRNKFLALTNNDPVVSKNLPLNIEDLPPNTEMKTWAEYKFKQMPVAACFPLLGKMQSDAKSSTSAIMNWAAEQMGKIDIKFDAFQPAVSAEKSYVIQGEKYSADIFLSAYSTSADNVSISVNGSSLPVKEGLAHYEVTGSGLGEKAYKVSINVKNPLNGEIKNYAKEFKYEVGQRSVAVSLDKMNVFYIGVENPVSVSAAGVSSNDVRVTGSGVNVANKGGGHYIITATTPGEATLTVAGGGASSTFKYRVKRIPDPIPLLGARHRGGSMGNGEFKAQGGIAAILENFDFDAKCDIVGFEATYLPKRQDPIGRPNGGARWNSEVADLVSKAKPGDSYFFDDIKCRCPGDPAARNIGGLAFKIR